MLVILLSTVGLCLPVYIPSLSFLCLVGYFYWIKALKTNSSTTSLIWILSLQLTYFWLYKSIAQQFNLSNASSLLVSTFVILILSLPGAIFLKIVPSLLNKIKSLFFFKKKSEDIYWIFTFFLFHLFTRLIFPWSPLDSLIQYPLTQNIALSLGHELFTLLFLTSIFKLEKYLSSHKESPNPPILFITLIFITVLYSEREKDSLQSQYNSQQELYLFHTFVNSKDKDLDYSADTLRVIETYQKTLLGYFDLNEKNKKLILWPESAFPGLPLEDPLDKEDFEKTLSLLPNTQHLVGLMHKRPPSDFFNSVALMNQEASLNILNRYDKVKLLPFGEYMPSSLKSLIPNALQEAIPNMSSGNLNSSFEIPEFGINVINKICYEALWAPAKEELLAKNNKFTSVIFNPSNDWWFKSQAQNQILLSIHQWIAIKTRSSIIKVSNGGYSYHIAPWGEVLLIEKSQNSLLLKTKIPIIGNR